MEKSCFVTYCQYSYLQLLKVVGVSSPVDLGKEVVVQHLAEELEQVNLHLVEALVLEQLVELRLPLLVVQRGLELPDERRHFTPAPAGTRCPRRADGSV